MIRCVRLFTDDTGQSDFEEGHLHLEAAQGQDLATLMDSARFVSFRETRSGGSFDWHNAPTFQFVITLKGNLAFESRTGKRFVLHPGDVLLAEDITGGGHRWRLLDDEPWVRAYVALSADTNADFVPGLHS